MANNQTVIATAGLLAVGVGSANAILKDKRAPSARFLIGSGVGFLLLSAMANGGEAMAEIAKGLALGIMTTVLLGEGGGVLSYLGGEVDTQKSKGAMPPKGSDEEQALSEGHQMSAVVTWFNPPASAPFHPGQLPVFPGLTPQQ